MSKYLKSNGISEFHLLDDSDSRGTREFTEQHREKLSTAKLGSKNHKARKVVDAVTGRIFSTVQEAADVNGYTRVHLTNMLAGHRTNKSTLRYAE